MLRLRGGQIVSGRSWCVRFALVVLTLATSIFFFVACSSDDCAATSSCDGQQVQPGPGGGGDGGGADGESEGGKTVGGPFSFKPIVPPEPRVMLGASMTVVLNVERTANQTEDIVISVSGAPNGVTFNPVTIKGSDSKGELVVNVAAFTKQGPFEATVEGTTATKEKASTKLSLLVRGKPGTIDTTFGVDGKRVINNVQLADNPAQPVIGSTGEIYFIIECAYQTNPNASCAFRLSADGVIDVGYGGLTAPMLLANPFAAALDSQGRLVVGGGQTGPEVGRFTAAGKVDTAFGGGGTGTLGIKSTNTDPLWLPALPTTGVVIGSGDSIYAVYAGGKIGVVRKVDSNGSLPAFGLVANSMGFQFAPPSGSGYYKLSRASGLALTPNKLTLVITGSWESDTGVRGFAVGHWDATAGSPDFAFESNYGQRSFASPAAVDASPRTMLMLPDGRVTAGCTSTGSYQAMAMFTAPGAADSSFNQTGVAQFNIVDGGGLTGAALQSDGAIVLSKANGLARLLPNGTLDPSFGQAGVASMVAGPIALQSDNRIIVGVYDGVAELYYVTRVWN